MPSLHPCPQFNPPSTSYSAAMFARSTKTRKSHEKEPSRSALFGRLTSETSLTWNTSSLSSLTWKTSSLSSSMWKTPSQPSLHDTSEPIGFVRVDDDELAVIAQNTRASIDWHGLIQSVRESPAEWRRHSSKDSDFTVATRTDARHHRVIATGVVRGCVAEILSVLQPATGQQYEQLMQAVYGNQFQQGDIVHVEPATLPEMTRDTDDVQLQELSIKSATFNKASWFSSYDEWCYVDAVYRRSSSGTVEKVMKTMRPEDIAPGITNKRTKCFHDVVCGYILRPDTHHSTGQAATHVMFYADFHTSKAQGFLKFASVDSPDKIIKQRLLKLAESTERLTALIQRQRLGLQTLVDKNHRLRPTTMPCTVCTRMVLVAKLCRVCGRGVCGNCSDKHERVMKPKANGKLNVVNIRVCASCVDRIDGARYENVTAASISTPPIIPDTENAPLPSSVLKNLLMDAWLRAASPAKKAPVASVIRHVLGQDMIPAATPSPAILEDEDDSVIHAFDQLQVEPLSNHDVEVRGCESRSYSIDTSGDPTINSTSYPVPENKAQRIRARRRVREAELSTICDLAALAMGCSMSTISLITDGALQIVAANVEELRNVSVPRNESICSHTIMERSANIVRHPEADIRFSKFASVDQFNVRYYCGFPIVDSHDQVIGAMCCVNSESVKITETQFATFKKLAATASRIVSGRSDAW